jgi:hypothetical protein
MTMTTEDLIELYRRATYAVGTDNRAQAALDLAVGLLEIERDRSWTKSGLPVGSFEQYIRYLYVGREQVYPSITAWRKWANLAREQRKAQNVTPPQIKPHLRVCR